MTTTIQLSEKNYHLLRARTAPDNRFLINSSDDNENAAAKREKKWLHCHNCRQQITSEDQRLVINNSHIHTYTNPEDFMFRIGCFNTAPGCSYRGAPTRQYSWFAGYSWRYAECSNCHLHLGWHFQKSGGDNFSGLILALLTEESE